MSDFALRAALQQMLGGSTAEEENFLLAELARRFIISGTTIDANGVIALGTATVAILSGTINGTLTVNNALITNAVITTLQATTANVDALTANVVDATVVTTPELNADWGQIQEFHATSVEASNTINALSVSATTVSANTVTANNLILPIQ